MDEGQEHQDCRWRGGRGDRRHHRSPVRRAPRREYGALCRKAIARLARKRPSPLLRGEPRTWAAGVIYAIGMVNFLTDPTQKPHMTTDRLSEVCGVGKSTLSAKFRIIQDLLRLGGPMDPEYCRRDLLANNPLAWMVKVERVHRRRAGRCRPRCRKRRGSAASFPISRNRRERDRSGPNHETESTSEERRPPKGQPRSARPDSTNDRGGHGRRPTNESEQATGWFTMFEERLELPFETQVLGATVTVTSIDLRGDDQINAICTRGPGPPGDLPRGSAATVNETGR